MTVSLLEEEIKALGHLAQRYNPDKKGIPFWSIIDWDLDPEIDYFTCNICHETFVMNDPNMGAYNEIVFDFQEHGRDHLREHGLLIFI